MSIMSCTEITLDDPRISGDWLPSTDNLAPRLINEESTLVAPWLADEEDDPVSHSPTPALQLSF